MRFEWDEAKRAGNLAKHGLDFALVEELDWAAASILEDTRQAYGEPRFRAFVPHGTSFVAVVFTPRPGALRIISVRPANRREVTRYGSQT